jgi:4-hydroxyphenylpyruvate dioxygenase
MAASVSLVAVLLMVDPSESQARGILLDGTTASGKPHLLLQSFSDTLLGPMLFELINLRAMGMMDSSTKRDQIRRGVLRSLQP